MFLIDRMDRQRMEARAATPMVSLIECNYDIRSASSSANVKFRENAVGRAEGFYETTLVSDELDLACAASTKPRRSPDWQILAEACINCR
jgi:hypothetical protein